MNSEDYWFQQRYDDAMFDEHSKDHPESDPQNCVWCINEDG